MNQAQSRLLILAVHALLLVGASSSLLAQDDEAGSKATTADAKKVRELLDLCSGGDYGKQLLDRLVAEFREEGATPEFLKNLVEAADTESLVAAVLPSWVEELEADDLDALLAFHRTPAGQRWLRVQCDAVGTVMEDARDWAQALKKKLDDPARGAGIEPNETRAVNSLRRIATAQAQFQSAAIVDQDSDGNGEFGFIYELSGIARYRVEGGIAKEPTRPEFIATEFGLSSMQNNGIVILGGYCYRIYLPTDSGPAMVEPNQPVEGVASHSDGQEVRFICYAWPLEIGVTGNRAFAVSQQGEVFSTANRDVQEYSGLESAPPPEAALIATGKDDASNCEGQMIAGEAAGDGQKWLPTGN